MCSCDLLNILCLSAFFPWVREIFYMHPLQYVTAYLDDRHKIFLFLLTEKTAADRRSCLCWGTPTHPYLWPVTDVFQLNVHWAAVQLCFIASGIMHLFSVVFCVVRTAHAFDFRLVMKAVPNKLWSVERKSWSDRDVLDRICMYISSRPSPGVSTDSTHALQVNCSLRRKTVLVLASSKMRGLCCTCAFIRQGFCRDLS